MLTARIAAIVAAAGTFASADAANIYVLSSSSPALDARVIAALQQHGHTATLGVQYTTFDGTQSLAGFQAVYFQANQNWNAGDMPAAGQIALLAFINAGGGMVTSEWVVYKAGGNFLTVAPALAATPTTSFNSNLTATYSLLTPEPILNAGLPSSFTFNVTSIAGCETHIQPRSGATVFYNSTANGRGVIGWNFGSGRTLCISTICSDAQYDSADFKRLLGNAFTWVARSCYANCDGSTTAPVLNVNDFTCFLNKFAASDAYANCDAGTVPPVLNVNDFTCFLNRYGAGCN